MIETIPRTILRACSLLLFLVASFEVCELSAQPTASLPGAGRRFVVAFPDTTKNTFDARYPPRMYEDRFYLLFYSAVPANVTITGRRYRNQITTTAGRHTVVDVTPLNATIMGVVTEHCRAIDSVFTIESDQPIILQQYMATKFGTEAWTPLPVDAWGTEYYAAAMPGEVGSDISPGGETDYRRKPKMFSSEILVVAAFDDTRISIETNGRVHNDCATSGIVLQAGQAFQIDSYVDTLLANYGIDQPDFAGSRIVATKPIGVITGNTRSQIIDDNVGLGRNAFKNMAIEWLTPVEQHGREFVLLPTWDRLNRGAVPIDTSGTLGTRPGELVRVYASRAGTRVSYTNGFGATVEAGTIDGGQAATLRFDGRTASLITTSRAAQVMMHTPGVVRYAGTTQGFGGYIGAAYDAWGGHMVELAPRHRWPSFAPVYAPEHAPGMEHRVNVVTDSSHRDDILIENGPVVAFDRVVPGTSLVWTTRLLGRGESIRIVGRNGARFFGHVYGTLSKGGHEEYRPGGAYQGDDPPQLVSRGEAGDAEILHPSEYEEYLGIAYAYPLAATIMRSILGPTPLRRLHDSVD